MQDSDTHKEPQDARSDALQDRLGHTANRQPQTAPQPPSASPQTEARLHSLFRAAPIAICLVSNRVLLEVNDRMCEMVGYAREELLEHDARILYPSDEDYNYVGTVEYGQIAEHGTGAVETRWRHKGGAVIDILLSSAALNPDDLFQRITFTALDITARKKAEQALRESEGRYRETASLLETLLNAIPDVIGLQDAKHHIIRYNAAGYAFLHTSPDEVHGQRCFELIGQDRPCEVCATSEVYRTQKPAQVEKYFAEMDLWLDVRAYPVLDDSGEITNVIEHLRDITSQKRAQKALEDSEARYRAVVEDRTEFICRFRPDGRVTFVNETLCRFYGQSREDLIGKNFSTWMTPEEHRQLWPCLEALTPEHPVITHEDRGILPGGQEFWGQWTNHAIFDEAGNVTEHQAVGRDITEQKNPAQALHASEQRFRALIERAGDGIFLHDVEGRFLDVNREACRSLGYTPTELLALTVGEIDAQVPHRNDVENLWKSDCPQESILFESTHTRKDGSTFPVEVRLGQLNLPEGRLILSLARDISERKQAEEEHRARLRSLESMERINRIIREATDPKQMLQDAIETVYSIFDCDRAWLLYPCDPQAPSFRVPVECVRPEYPGVNALDLEVPLHPGQAQEMRDALASEEPLVYIVGTDATVATATATQFSVQSQMLTAVYPKVGQPWLFGLHQCSYRRVWTTEEQRLFQEIGHRIADGLSSTLSLRNLKESETRFRELAELLPQTVFETDAEGRFTFVNRLACESFGYEQEELPVLHLADLFAFGDRQRLTQNFHKRLRGEPFWDHEYMAQRKNGTTFPILVYSAPIIQNGIPVGLRGVAVDITERQYAEQALQESKAKLESIFESSPNAICVTDLEGNIVDCNPATLETYGHTAKDELLGHSLFDLIGAGDRIQAREVMQHTVAEGLTKDVELTLLKKDGRKFPSEVSASLMTDPAGHPMGLVTAMADITERKQAQDALRESEQKFRSLVETSSDWIWEIDREGRYTYASPKVKDLLGYEPEEIIAKTPFDFVSAQEKQSAIEFFADLLESPRAFADFVNVNLHKNGSEVTLETNGVPIYDADGDFLGYRGVDRDITERKRLEQALERRILALTQPLSETEGVEFEDLFDLDEIQTLQDLFAKATNVASIITHPDGTPITQPSHFCRLCETIIRKTAKGLKNCYYSDSVIGDHNPNGPIVQPCLSGGLWDAGASITVGGKHIANWLIGQVRNDTQDEEKMLEYAREIGADADAFRNAFREVPIMSREQFEGIANALFVIADQLSTTAYQNVQQARFIADRRRAAQALQESERKLATLMANLPGMAYRCLDDGAWTMEFVSEGCADLTGYASEDVIGNQKIAYNEIVHPDDRRDVHVKIKQALAAHHSFEIEYRILTAQGQEKWVWERGRQVNGIDGPFRILEGFILDVSERRSAEQKLQAYQKKLKSLASELSLAEERERRRMAAGLHDHICQNLVLSKMKLQSLSPSLPGCPAQAVEAICQTLNETIQSIRELTFDLSSPILYKFGLVAALEELLKDKVRGEHHIHCQFTDDGQPKPLSQDVLVLLFQSVRELIINMIKHAQAHEVGLDIRREIDSIRIVLTDDGIGFDVSEVLSFPSRKRSVGLFNILERLDYIGGNLDMESQPGCGSRFTLVAPLITETDVAKEPHDGSENSTR